MSDSARQNWIATIVRGTVLVTLIAAVLVSMATYFTALSQYPTGDQAVTLERLQLFLSDFNAVILWQGSLVSNLFVAIPGRILASILDAFYAINDPIIPGIRYTPLLPYAIAQVVLALGLMCALSFFIVKLAVPSRWNWSTYFLALLFILNFPMLKAVSKVVKYDVLSALLSAMAIVLYIAYRQYDRRPPSDFFGKFCLPAIVILCGLAFLEKDTTISTMMLIFVLELVVIAWTTPTRREAFAEARRFSGLFAVTLLITFFVAVPKVAANPLSLRELFRSILSYFVNFPLSAVFLIATILFISYWFAPLARMRLPMASVWTMATSSIIAVSGLAIWAFGLTALLFQENILYDVTIAGNGLDVDALRAQGIYVSQPIANAAITTLDTSALVQHAKMFLSMVRVIFYTLPEVSILLIVSAAPIVLFSGGGTRSVKRDIALILTLAFPVAMLLAFSLSDLPFEPKYLVLVNLLLTANGLIALVILLERMPAMVGNAIRLALGMAIVLAAMSAGPSYLPYKNVFRDRALENAAATDTTRYLWWTWPGWGETAYPIAQFVERELDAPATVAFDYIVPFYAVPDLKWIHFDCNSAEDLAKLADEYRSIGVDYVAVSKNMTNRNWCSGHILEELRDKAVFVDNQQGIEYGWLFRVEDIFHYDR
jgi:hypothetical protein